MTQAGLELWSLPGCFQALGSFLRLCSDYLYSICHPRVWAGGGIRRWCLNPIGRVLSPQPPQGTVPSHCLYYPCPSHSLTYNVVNLWLSIQI